MNRRRICSLSVAGLLMLTTSAFASTFYVGTCHTTIYQTISAAVAAAPAGATIKVCPGRYPEQVAITQAVTLEGISSDGSDQAIVVSPPNGMVVNAWDDLGDPIAAQLFVDPISGFTISNLTFDASNNEVSGDAYVVGIFVQNSSGTINHIVTRNQTGGDGGVGVWMEGGASNPTVTLENSSIHDFSDIGIWTQTNSAASQLNATIKNNFVNGTAASGIIGIIDIAINEGSTNTVSDNYAAGGQTGIWVSGAADGTVAHNNLITDGTAVAIGADGNTGGNVSVTDNDIFNSSVEGIVVYSGLPAVQHNNIAGTPIGIDFACNADGNIKSNTIMDASTGDANLPAGSASGDSFYNIQTQTGGCSGPATRTAERRSSAPASR